MDLFEQVSAPACFSAQLHGFMFRFTRWSTNPSRMNPDRELCHDWIVSWEGSANWSEHFTGWHCPMLFTEQEIVDKFAAEIFPAIWPPQWQRQRVGLAA